MSRAGSTKVPPAASDTAPWAKIAHDPARLSRRLDEIRALGLATMDENYSRIEYDGRIGSVGVPIMTGRKLFASMNVIYLNTTLSPQGARDGLVGPLQDVARRMAEELDKTGMTSVML